MRGQPSRVLAEHCARFVCQGRAADALQLCTHVLTSLLEDAIDHTGHAVWAQSKALRALWMSVSPDDAARMIELLDTDHDGQMSLDELRSFVYLLPEAQVPCLPLAAAHAWLQRTLRGLGVHAEGLRRACLTWWPLLASQHSIAGSL